MRTIVYLLIFSILLVFGCSQQEDAAEKPQARQETPVIVPQEVAESWKAVKVVAIDMTSGKEQMFIVDVGGEFIVPQSDLAVKVRHFLPSFVRDGKVISSSSNKLDNPAIMIRVTEKWQEIFNGWLFGLYPEAHNFRHDRFTFQLAGQIPAQKKG